MKTPKGENETFQTRRAKIDFKKQGISKCPYSDKDVFSLFSHGKTHCICRGMNPFQTLIKITFFLEGNSSLNLMTSFRNSEAVPETTFQFSFI